MAKINPKLAFIQSIAEQERLQDQQISAEIKSALNILQRSPKSYYTLQDIEKMLEGLKVKMQEINKSTHTEFSKRGLKEVDNLDLMDTSVTLITIEELDQLKRENTELKEQNSDITTFEMKINDLNILLEEKEALISQLKSKPEIDSKKVQETIQELNRLQKLYDESQREFKKAIMEKEKFETEFENIGNTLMATRLEIEELQEVLAKKDIEIGNLTSEVQVLSIQAEENIKIKETLNNREKERETIKNELRDYRTRISNLEKELKNQEEKIEELEQENEDLLLDSGETAQEAVELRRKLTDLQKNLDQREAEFRELSIKAERSDRDTQEVSEHLQNRLNSLQDELNGTRKINLNLESKIKELDIEIKSKNERITIIEKDKEKLLESFSNLKIEQEKQKSTINDLKTQLTTKESELDEIQKELETQREAKEEISHLADSSRSKQAEAQRERDIFETKIRALETRIKDFESANERLEKRTNELSKDLEKVSQDLMATTNLNKKLEKSNLKLKDVVETLRVNLAKNPKFALLFILQDIRQASVGELAKSAAIQLAFAARLLQDLHSEGWIEFNEETGIASLKKSLLEAE
ncbi:hypothetical protein [Candidatus Hodarchaeum mangrovi]